MLSDYTHAMNSTDPPDYLSGDLRICASRGLIAHASGESIRLGPVNMSVLVTLLERASATVSRAEIYECVWGNQLVGEDALTRCISDVRAELRKLSDRDDWIETVPKRGYRWCEPVRLAAASVDQATAAASPMLSVLPPPRSLSTAQRLGQHKGLRLAARGAGYGLALLIIASLLVGAIDWLAAPAAPIVAVLPVVADQDRAALAAELDVQIRGYVTGLAQIRVLSPSAVEARPANPFPFFYYEFGARWLIESELRSMSEYPMLTLTLADARTGIVELQVTQQVQDANLTGGKEPPTALTDLGRFIDAMLAR